MRPPIQAFLPEEIATAHDLKLAEVRKVLSAVHQRALDRLDLAMPQVSRRARELLAATYGVGELEVVDTANSSLDPFTRLVLRAPDGALIEAVRIPLEKPGRFSVCISSQVGCGLGCAFCKTAQLGLVRNLEAWELVEQVRVMRRTLPAGARITGVVFQGMGEPLANLDAVIRAVRVLSDPCGQCVDQKAITVCTAGLAANLRRLTEAKLRVRVGLSIASARPSLRRQLMPIETRVPLRDAVAALIEHTRVCKRSPMLSFTLIQGVNTHPEDAAALVTLCQEIGEASGRRPRLSLVPYNSRGPEDPFRRADEAEAEAFRLALVAGGFPVVRRYSGGADIGAACGQLAAIARNHVAESASC
ncbi:MAG TPA: radical SAM protein [Polyangiaceae bacterium]|nr:radical SAM protein [Polyangiaceae bacterium]